MPLPRVVARLNKRYTNKFIEPLVRRLGGFAVVEHIGRRSGKHYRTPVLLFDASDAFIVALTYGPSADWVQNVLANGGRLHRDDHTAAIDDALVVDRATAWPHIPWFTRLALRLLRVHQFMQLRPRSVEPAHPSAPT